MGGTIAPISLPRSADLQQKFGGRLEKQKSEIKCVQTISGIFTSNFDWVPKDESYSDRKESEQNILKNLKEFA